jgi:hypothetical protein
VLASGRAVVGLTVSLVGLFCTTGATIEGILGANTDGKFGYIRIGFCGAATKGLFGAIIDSGRAVVGLPVAMVGMLVSTGAPRVGIVGAIADGVFGAVTDGKLGVINKGFWELFGAILVSGRVVVGLSVVMVGTFGSAGATIEGLFGAISDGASGAVADGKTGGFSTGICGATTVGLFAGSLVSGRAVVGLSVAMVGTFSSVGDPIEGAFGANDGFFGCPIKGFLLYLGPLYFGL